MRQTTLASTIFNVDQLRVRLFNTPQKVSFLHEPDYVSLLIAMLYIISNLVLS